MGFTVEKESGETLSNFIKRVCQQKKDNNKLFTWEDVAEYIKLQTGFDRREKYYRTERYLTLGENGELDMLTLLKMKKVEISDERTQANAYYRSLSREQTIKDIASDYADKMRGYKRVIPERREELLDSEKEAILQVSDWHFGYDIHNAWNTYSPEICKLRVRQLINTTVAKCRKEGVHTLHFVNLGDMVAGRIHQQIRIQSREDLVGQTMFVSEILAEMIGELSMYFEIKYYDCTDNHSRLEPNKKESLQLETMTRIIHWYLKQRFKDDDRITIYENEYGEDIITFSCNGHKVVGTHGDKDGATNVVDRLSGLTGNRYALCLTAHRHHFFGDEKNYTVLLSNGSLCGVDEFSVDHRLTSTPSQNLIITTPENVTEAIYRIILK